MKQRVVKKTAILRGNEFVNVDDAAQALAEMVPLKSGEVISDFRVLDDEPKSKAIIVVHRGPAKTVYRIQSSWAEDQDFDKLPEARKALKMQLEQNPGGTATVNKVSLRDGHSVCDGKSELIRRRMTVEVTITAE